MSAVEECRRDLRYVEIEVINATILADLRARALEPASPLMAAARSKQIVRVRRARLAVFAATVVDRAAANVRADGVRGLARRVPGVVVFEAGPSATWFARVEPDGRRSVLVIGDDADRALGLRPFFHPAQ